MEIGIGKLKSYKSPGTDNIPAELIKAEGETLYSEIRRLICCIWNKEELPQQWKESIIVPIYEKGDKTDCNNYRGISLLSTAYKILGEEHRLRVFKNRVLRRYLDLKGRKMDRGGKKARDHRENLGVDGRITLRWTLGR
jgi:hypothetical protein